ncbi:MAG: hypothetical protein K6G80_11445 [Treponema sp.]|nr:hypothetical protein [Treponema sp.]
MQQKPFIMTNEPLPGKMSAAILFTELGSGVTEKLLPYFSTKELKKLSRAIKALPPYKVEDTLQVLQRTEDYAKDKGFYVEVPRNPLLAELDEDMRRENEFRKRVGGNTEEVAQVLGAWLNAD